MTSAAPIPADVVEKVDALGPPGTPVTTPEVAEGFDCTQRTIYNRLESLVDDGVLQTKKVGANSRVWWRPVESETQRRATTLDRERIRSHPVFDSEMVGIIVWGRDATSGDTADLVIEDANDAFLKIAGFEYEEALETSWRDLTPAEFYEVSEQHIEEVDATGSGVAYDKQYYHADGSRWWGLFESQKLDDDTYVEFVVDITDRKEAKERLRESEQRLQKAISIDTVGVLFFDLEGNISDANAAFERMSGYSRAELREIDWVTLTPPEFMDVTDRKASELATRGETAPYEKQLIHEDGSRWWGLFAPQRLSGTGDTANCVEFIIDITDRKETEAKLRESEARYRTVLNSMDEGFFLADVVFDRDGEPLDIFYRDSNPAATEMVGEEFTGRWLTEIDPGYEDYWFETFGRVAATGDGERTVLYAEPDGIWYDFYVFKPAGAGSRRVAVIFQDITERKRLEEELQEQADFDSFRVDLTDVIRPLTDPVEVQREAARALGEELGADRVQYGDVLDDQNTNVVYADYHRDDMDSLVGEHRLTAYGEYIAEGFRAGETLAVDDVETYPNLSREALETCRQARIRAWIGVPLIKDDVLEAFVSVTESTARAWTDTEIEMAEETAERTWAAVERARAEQNLRESEERYRTLFESIIEGFCTIEVLFDEDDEPVDYRFLETNPAFEEQTGLDDAEGKRMRELEPNHEDHWFEIYGRIAKTGQSERFTNRAKHLNDRWYDVNAFRIGDPDERKVAIAFKDISDTKNYQIALERLNAASRELIDADTETIRDRVAEFTRDILDVEYATLWRYDEISGEIREAVSSTVSGIEPGALQLPDESIDTVWQTFIGDDIDVENDLDGSADDSSGPQLRSRVLLPLGRYGVVCVGSTRTGAFDEQKIDLGETVAATIVTAWDRADSEQELGMRNEELTRLDRLNTLIRGIDQALVTADTREEIDEAVCERLADSELYEFAWIGVYDAEARTVAPRAWAGVDSAYLDTLRTEKRDTVTSDSPFTAAVRAGELQVVADVATDARAAPWREETLERGGRSCLCIPLAYEGSVYGVLTVYGDTPHQEARDTEVLAELGQTIAHAIYAIETRDSVRTDTVYELTLESAAAETPLCRLSRTTGCVIDFEGEVTGADGHTTVFFTTSGVDPDEFEAACEQSVAVDDLVRLDDRDDGVFYKAHLTDSTVAGVLLDEGATVRSLSIDAGTVTAVVDLPDTAEVSTVLTAIRRSIPDIELLARQTRTRATDRERTLETAFEERLTPRQREVLQLAYRSGFFESPRLQTGKELSEALDLSQSTFNYHLRGAERTLFELVFDAS